MKTLLQKPYLIIASVIFVATAVASCKQARYEFVGKKKTTTTSQTLNPEPPTLGYSFTISADPTQQKPNLPINFAGSGCGMNNDGRITWQFGDGLAGEGVAVTHRYKYKGDFTVDATCETTDGNKLTAQLVINILAPDCSNPCGNPGQSPGQNP